MEGEKEKKKKMKETMRREININCLSTYLVKNQREMKTSKSVINYNHLHSLLHVYTYTYMKNGRRRKKRKST